MGGGIEARLLGNWTGKLEYLYIDYGKVVTSVTDPLNSTPIMLTFYSRLRENIVRAGLNYKFSPLP
jgi:outer membrane immunogenic protein